MAHAYGRATAHGNIPYFSLGRTVWSHKNGVSFVKFHAEGRQFATLRPERKNTVEALANKPKINISNSGMFATNEIEKKNSLMGGGRGLSFHDEVHVLPSKSVTGTLLLIRSEF